MFGVTTCKICYNYLYLLEQLQLSLEKYRHCYIYHTTTEIDIALVPMIKRLVIVNK